MVEINQYYEEPCNLYCPWNIIRTFEVAEKCEAHKAHAEDKRKFHILIGKPKKKTRRKT
jgi:hypothetical protein